MVPIVVGYVIAHYLTFFVSVSIETLQQLGDPLSRGWTLTSFASGINPFAIYNHPTAIGITKVVAVVAGHVLAVISAHDRAVALLPRRKAHRRPAADARPDGRLHPGRPRPPLLLLVFDHPAKLTDHPADLADHPSLTADHPAW